ncbi:MAG: ribokinase [Gammaproteobacteria bacterium]|nr:ribokinase [Gammaproteobacteria bacterium]
MLHNAKILNFGSLNIDHVYHIDTFITPGETKLSQSLNKFAGGKGNNQSIALAKAGAMVYHAGAVGKDGQFLLDNLKKENVNTDYIYIDPQNATGHAIIQVNNQGENCILLHGGANQAITVNYINHVLSNFTKGDILLIQNEISNLDKIIELAGAKEMVIYFNPAPMCTKLLNYPLEYIDTFIVNQPEGMALTNGSTSEEILDRMTKLFPTSKVILTLGDRGVIYQDQNQRIPQSAYPVEAVDTTAAGDTFLGYFLASLQKNIAINKALDIACRAASITVTRQGATSSIPYLSELNI